MVNGFVVYGLRETYAELGEYEFRVVLDPKKYSDSHESTLSIVDSDGNRMPHNLRRWGRKMNCSFVVDEETADGVSSINLELKSNDGSVDKVRLSMWIIKP